MHVSTLSSGPLMHAPCGRLLRSALPTFVLAALLGGPALSTGCPPLCSCWGQTTQGQCPQGCQAHSEESLQHAIWWLVPALHDREGENGWIRWIWAAASTLCTAQSSRHQPQSRPSHPSLSKKIVAIGFLLPLASVVGALGIARQTITAKPQKMQLQMNTQRAAVNSSRRASHVAKAYKGQAAPPPPPAWPGRVVAPEVQPNHKPKVPCCLPA